MRVIEKWKDIEGYEGVYQISSIGRVKSLERYVNNGSTEGCKIKERIRKVSLAKGYYKTTLCAKPRKDKTIAIHRLVALSFKENPKNKPHVNHIDGNKLNNCVSNLEWMTALENMRHAIKNGLMTKGVDLPQTKLNDLQIRVIRRLKGEMLQREIANIFNVTRSNICYILGRKSRLNVIK